MCSIAGFFCKKPISGHVAHQLTSALLFYGADRGDQSSGVLVNSSLLKKAVAPNEFIDLAEYEKLFNRPVKSALIHTRFPTSGGRGDDQAQPFVKGETATIHNGWFVNEEELVSKWGLHNKSGVDSELVASFIQKHGINKLPRFIQTSIGTSAFGIFHKNSMYLMRDGNPTVFTVIDTSDGNYIFIFASTDDILNLAVRYCWLLDSAHPVNDTKEGVLFKVQDGDLKALSERIWSKTHNSYGKNYYDSKEFYYDKTDHYDQSEAVSEEFPEAPYFSPAKRLPSGD